jgi:hypothetical protein
VVSQAGDGVGLVIWRGLAGWGGLVIWRGLAGWGGLVIWRGLAGWGGLAGPMDLAGLTGLRDLVGLAVRRLPAGRAGGQVSLGGLAALVGRGAPRRDWPAIVQRVLPVGRKKSSGS